MTQKFKVVADNGEVDFESDLTFITTCIQGAQTQTAVMIAPDIDMSTPMIGMLSNICYSAVSSFLKATEHVEMSEDFKTIFEDFITSLDVYDRRTNPVNSNKRGNERNLRKEQKKKKKNENSKL